MKTLFTLIFAHALGDTVLQTQPMAAGKRGEGVAHWSLWLISHMIIHSGLVLIVTDSLIFALVECGAHGIIDWLKVERKITCLQDQALHGLCKLIYSLTI